MADDVRPAYDDAMAAEDRRSKSLPFRLHVETFPLFRLAGEVTGAHVRDLAGGEGICIRLQAER